MSSAYPPGGDDSGSGRGDDPVLGPGPAGEDRNDRDGGLGVHTVVRTPVSQDSLPAGGKPLDPSAKLALPSLTPEEAYYLENRRPGPVLHSPVAVERMRHADFAGRGARDEHLTESGGQEGQQGPPAEKINAEASEVAQAPTPAPPAPSTDPGAAGGSIIKALRSGKWRDRLLTIDNLTKAIDSTPAEELSSSEYLEVASEAIVALGESNPLVQQSAAAYAKSLLGALSDQVLLARMAPFCQKITRLICTRCLGGSAALESVALPILGRLVGAGRPLALRVAVGLFQILESKSKRQVISAVSALRGLSDRFLEKAAPLTIEGARASVQQMQRGLIGGLTSPSKELRCVVEGGADAYVAYLDARELVAFLDAQGYSNAEFLQSIEGEISRGQEPAVLPAGGAEGELREDDLYTGPPRRVQRVPPLGLEPPYQGDASPELLSPGPGETIGLELGLDAGSDVAQERLEPPATKLFVSTLSTAASRPSDVCPYRLLERCVMPWRSRAGQESQEGRAGQADSLPTLASAPASASASLAAPLRPPRRGNAMSFSVETAAIFLACSTTQLGIPAEGGAGDEEVTPQVFDAVASRLCSVEHTEDTLSVLSDFVLFSLGTRRSDSDILRCLSIIRDLMGNVTEDDPGRPPGSARGYEEDRVGLASLPLSLAPLLLSCAVEVVVYSATLSLSPVVLSGIGQLCTHVVSAFGELPLFLAAYSAMGTLLEAVGPRQTDQTPRPIGAEAAAAVATAAALGGPTGLDGPGGPEGHGLSVGDKLSECHKCFDLLLQVSDAMLTPLNFTYEVSGCSFVLLADLLCRWTLLIPKLVETHSVAGEAEHSFSSCDLCAKMTQAYSKLLSLALIYSRLVLRVKYLTLASVIRMCNHLLAPPGAQIPGDASAGYGGQAQKVIVRLAMSECVAVLGIIHATRYLLSASLKEFAEEAWDLAEECFQYTAIRLYASRDGVFGADGAARGEGQSARGAELSLSVSKNSPFLHKKFGHFGLESTTSLSDYAAGVPLTPSRTRQSALLGSRRADTPLRDFAGASEFDGREGEGQQSDLAGEPAEQTPASLARGDGGDPAIGRVAHFGQFEKYGRPDGEALRSTPRAAAEPSGPGLARMESPSGEGAKISFADIPIQAIANIPAKPAQCLVLLSPRDTFGQSAEIVINSTVEAFLYDLRQLVYSDEHADLILGTYGLKSLVEFACNADSFTPTKRRLSAKLRHSAISFEKQRQKSPATSPQGASRARSAGRRSSRGRLNDPFSAPGGSTLVHTAGDNLDGTEGNLAVSGGSRGPRMKSHVRTVSDTSNASGRGQGAQRSTSRNTPRKSAYSQEALAAMDPLAQPRANRSRPGTPSQPLKKDVSAISDLGLSAPFWSSGTFGSVRDGVSQSGARTNRMVSPLPSARSFGPLSAPAILSAFCKEFGGIRDSYARLQLVSTLREDLAAAFPSSSTTFPDLASLDVFLDILRRETNVATTDAALDAMRAILEFYGPTLLSRAEKWAVCVFVFFAACKREETARKAEACLRAMIDPRDLLQGAVLRKASLGAAVMRCLGGTAASFLYDNPSEALQQGIQGSAARWAAEVLLPILREAASSGQGGVTRLDPGASKFLSTLHSKAADLSVTARQPQTRAALRDCLRAFGENPNDSVLSTGVPKSPGRPKPAGRSGSAGLRPKSPGQAGAPPRGDPVKLEGRSSRIPLGESVGARSTSRQPLGHDQSRGRAATPGSQAAGVARSKSPGQVRHEDPQSRRPGPARQLPGASADRARPRPTTPGRQRPQSPAPASRLLSPGRGGAAPRPSSAPVPYQDHISLDPAICGVVMQLNVLYPEVCSEDRLPERLDAAVLDIVAMASAQIAYISANRDSPAAKSMEASCYSLGLILYSIIASPAMQEVIIRNSADLHAAYPGALQSAGKLVIERYSGGQTCGGLPLRLGIAADLALLLLSSEGRPESGESAARYLIELFELGPVASGDARVEILVDVFTKYPALLLNGADRALRDLLKASVALPGSDPVSARAYIQRACAALDEVGRLAPPGAPPKASRAARAARQILSSCLAVLQ